MEVSDLQRHEKQNVTSVIDLLLQSNWTELWSQFRTESKTVIKSFIRSVDWSERWIHFLFITFIAWFGMIVKYRYHWLLVCENIVTVSLFSFSRLYWILLQSLVVGVSIRLESAYFLSVSYLESTGHIFLQRTTLMKMVCSTPL